MQKFLKGEDKMKKLLTVAGSDSIGGAGIQADIKTFSAHGCYAMSVITAVTAQNTVAVRASQDISAEIIQKQLDAVFEDVFPDGVKIGMLSVPETIEVIRERLVRYKPKIIVADPVMVSKSGFRLLSTDAEKVYAKHIIPIATVLTPNIPEAEILCGMSIKTRHDMEEAAEKLISLGAKAVVVKGGHLSGDADDFVFDGKEKLWLRGKRFDTKNTHGTGCTLSSAICANLANGYGLFDAVKNAKEYINGAIENSLAIGSGCGPTNHFYKTFNKKEN